MEDGLQVGFADDALRVLAALWDELVEWVRSQTAHVGQLVDASLVQIGLDGLQALEAVHVWH